MAPNSETECKLENLPSRKIYNKFKGNGHANYTCPNISSWTNEIENILDGKITNNYQHEVVPYSQQIAKTLCLLTKVNDKRTVGAPCEKVLCDFFYFWLSDLLHGKLRGVITVRQGGSQHISQKVVIRQIFETLNGLPSNLCASRFMHNNIEADFNAQRRKILDYYYDHRTIWNNIKNNQSAGSSCAVAYTQYLSDAQSAYGQLSATTEDPNDHFLTNFWKKNFKDQSKIPKPENLQSEATKRNPPALSGEEDSEIENLLSCLAQLSSVAATLPSNEDSQVQASHKQDSTHDRSSTSSQHQSFLFNNFFSDDTNIVTLSSVMAAGAIFPLIGSLLYKYDLLPSGIRKFFFSGRSGTRMRRTTFEPNSGTEMENFTEYYTENGSTTTDPTEYSTVAGSSSNLTTTSTEDSSILYNEDGPSRSPSPRPLPRKKRGRGNNRRGQNISYHSMEG
ncbi:KIR protein [Plasmodium knowlesi strain H]|uniref:KIR protein n=3 Tax=Plasmodium knowlesi TaxID=5850 RepID=A0A5K1UBT0_PLAKH|nr:KIR protein [Plasmodium knowlesi strain H]OTN67424.1 KIR protein [Plasmodium knowlesi]CAA9987550.1 KIR protein [Plasmodium knowlesi strain H]SBO23076.1 KIR protein [Plasmodium knowlesi strain H]SBO23742.1 KIR protein [Plasmodium knowlesi strain H]VVS77024.1 KIR protein [Plasmodium knowlesi strain H]|eukprot:XP_002258552.1 KIR protein [Plasmodium knowlesi strain H]